MGHFPQEIPASFYSWKTEEKSEVRNFSPSEALKNVPLDKFFKVEASVKGKQCATSAGSPELAANSNCIEFNTIRSTARLLRPFLVLRFGGAAS